MPDLDALTWLLLGVIVGAAFVALLVFLASRTVR